MSWKFLSFLSGMALLGCAKPAPIEEPREYPVAAPQPAADHLEQEYVGEVFAVQHSELRARFKGYLEAVGTDEGRAVKKGQLLFSIGAREAQAALLKAQAAVRSASAELHALRIEQKNAQMLFDRKVISETEMSLLGAKIASLEAKVEEARAGEAEASIHLSWAQLKAPFDGVVNRIPHKAGSLVDEDDLLTTVSNTEDVLVYFRVSEAESLRWSAAENDRREQRVALRLADGTLHPEPGVIDAVESELDRSTGNMAVRARVFNPMGQLKHGSTCKVIVRSKLEGALAVPQKSTFEIQEHVYVYVVDAQNKAHARRVVPRLRLGDAFILESGLEPSDRIVLEGAQKIREGETIVARPAGTRAAAPSL